MTLDQGLSGNCVRSILQDSIGYMWFATQDGLNRFNGIEFTNYGHSSENGGNSYMNIVTICRHQDNNQIWVASTEKLYLFDSREEKFSVFDTQTEDGVTVNSVFGMAYDNDGQLWIGTANGLFVYNEKKGTLRQYLHSLSDPHSLPDNHVWVIYNDSFGTIWIAPGMVWQNTTNARTTSQGIYPKILLSDVLPATRLSL